MRTLLLVFMALTLPLSAGGRKKGMQIGEGLRADVSDLNLGKIPKGTVKYFSFGITNESKSAETIFVGSLEANLYYKEPKVTIQPGETYVFKGKLVTGPLKVGRYGSYNGACFGIKTDKDANGDAISVKAEIVDSYNIGCEWLLLKPKKGDPDTFEGALALKKADDALPDLKGVEPTAKGVDATLDKTDAGWTLTVTTTKAIIDAGPIGSVNLVPEANKGLQAIPIPLVPARGLTVIPNEVIFRGAGHIVQRPGFYVISGEGIKFNAGDFGLLKMPEEGVRQYGAGAGNEKNGVYMYYFSLSAIPGELKKDSYTVLVKTNLAGYKQIDVPVKVLK